MSRLRFPRSRSVSKPSLAQLITFVLALCPIEEGNAATRQWTGSSTSGNWSAAANWNPPGAPANGDDLLFVPALLPAAELFATNDLAGLRLNSITFDGTNGGFFLRGNPITLTNGILAMHSAGTDTIALAVANGAVHTL